jgi:hypothetical protein
MILAAKTAYRAAFRAYATANGNDQAAIDKASQDLADRRGDVLDAILKTLTDEATAQQSFDL